MNSRLNFSLTQMEYILAVHRSGSFAEAAKVCGVTQPTLSMQIQKLESDLGGILFDRGKKPILLTNLGLKIIEQAKSILTEAKKIPDIIETFSSEAPKGTLRVGIIPTLAPYLLPYLLPALESRLPHLELSISELQTDKIIDSLNLDQIDAGILATPLKNPKIFEFPLYYEKFFLLCNNNHPLTKIKKIRYSDIHYEDIWLLQEGHCLRNQILDVCALKKSSQEKRHFKFESGSIETLKNIIATYGGYTLIPEMAAQNLTKQLISIPLERPIPAREIGLVYQREHYKRNLIEALGDTIISAIPDSIRKLRKKDLDIIPIA